MQYYINVTLDHSMHWSILYMSAHCTYRNTTMVKCDRDSQVISRYILGDILCTGGNLKMSHIDC